MSGGFLLRSTVAIVAACTLPLPAAKDAYRISGYVGQSSTQPASGVTVRLLEPGSDKELGSVRTGFTGRYRFDNLKPGLYVLEAGPIKRELAVKDKDVRLDIDLSAKDGQMRYAKAEDIAKAVEGAATAAAGGAPPAGPLDARSFRRHADTES